MIDLTMKAYKEGDRIVLADDLGPTALSALLGGKHGVVYRVVKARRVFTVKLEDGRFYDAPPCALRPETQQ